MKILLINNCHYPRGGADIVYLNTGKLLEQNAHEVIYFSQRHPKNEEHPSAKYFVNQVNYFSLSLIKRIWLIPRFFYSFEARRNLSKLIKQEKPDLAHIHLYKGTLTPSILVALKRNNVPVIISLHDYGFLCPHNLLLNGKQEICEKCIRSSPLNCIKYRCNNNNLLYSTISSLEYIFHKRFVPYHKYFDKIIAVSKFSQNKHSLREELKPLLDHLYNFHIPISNTPNSNKGDYFLYYGRLSKEKGLMTLLDAWKMIKQPSRLIIAGDGDMYGAIQNKITKEGIKNVDLVGFKSGVELQDLVRESSFIIVPSEWYENNPMTIVEAYSSGKPVIGSRVGGIPEIIVENQTGFTFEMSNRKELVILLEKALAMSKEEYLNYSNHAVAFWRKHFFEKQHYESLTTIYKEVITNKFKTNGQKT